MPTRTIIFLLGFALGAATTLPAAVIGTNSAALPLTRERITKLPTAEQPAWKQYLTRSEQQARTDHEFFWNEMRRHGVRETTSPPPGRGARGLALNRPEEWYRSTDALRIADIVVSFQTPAGGWSKNLDMTRQPRRPGERFAQGNVSRFTNPDDLDLPRDPNWNYVGTFDNGATTTQLRFLARVASAVDEETGRPYRESVVRGLDYIFAAQYPNGGWPQVWPLQGGYHDSVTFNDSAMTAILDLLFDVAETNGTFAFLTPSVRELADASRKRGLDCVLQTQLLENGKRSIWCQQYDVLTLRPTSARNYEMPSLSAGESADIMLFLMRLPAPDSNIVAAVHATAAWFKHNAVYDKAYRRVEGEGFRLVASPGSGPLWSRYSELGSHRAIFGERDKTIHDTLDDISRERRDGYAWYTDAPQEALERYDRWRASNP